MLNTAVIMGRLTADPELRQTPNGVSVTSFTVACDRNYSSRSGGERPCDFIDVVAWRQTAEFVCKYFSKGSMIIVQGSIQTRMYQDRNGITAKRWKFRPITACLANPNAAAALLPQTTATRRGLLSTRNRLPLIRAVRPIRLKKSPWTTICRSNARTSSPLNFLL